MRARALASLLSYALMAGIVVAAAAFPVALIVGLASKAASDKYLALPSTLMTPPTAQTTNVYASDGKTLITSFYDENRRDVPLDQIAPVMQKAIVAAEDVRFYQHGGVDLKAIVRAAVSDANSGVSQQGASTLTMQYVRNVLKNDPNLSPQQRIDATSDTPGRKLQEARYAIALEKTMSKSEILDRYLNITYFGDGAYGIFAASETYFGKPATDLTLAEAALLAGVVQSPDTDNPAAGGEKAALARRAYVLGAMRDADFITQAQYAAANAEPLKLNAHQQPNDCAAVAPQHNDWGFFCDYLRQWWDNNPAFGSTVEDRDEALKDGGYTVVTSLSPTIQAEALKQSLSVYGYDNAKSLPMAVVQPGTGRILAMAVNRHYSLAANPKSHPKYPNTVNQLIAGGGSVNGYQTGSTFKMFTMLAALELGKTLDTAFVAPSPILTRFPVDAGPASCGGYWCPSNDNPGWMDGRRTMWTGFGRSVNTYFVWLEEQIGPQYAVAMAQRLGIVLRAQSDADLAKRSAGWGAFTLGVADTTPLDLANAYATVANKGAYCSPLPVMSITDFSGHHVPASDPTCKQVVAPDIAAAAADAARCPVGQQSAYGQCDGGTALMVSGIVGRPVGGKTGSSEDNATETFVGITPQVAAAGIACDPDNPRDAVGGYISASVDIAVANTMKVALKGLPVINFPAPSRQIAFKNRTGPAPAPSPTYSANTARVSGPGSTTRVFQFGRNGKLPPGRVPKI
jgi:membrane peptidoglycan carboxypeptidase